MKLYTTPATLVLSCLPCIAGPSPSLAHDEHKTTAKAVVDAELERFDSSTSIDVDEADGFADIGRILPDSFRSIENLLSLAIGGARSES